MTASFSHAPTRTVEVGGVPFAYRDVGAAGATPVVFLHHFTAVLDDWDPAVVDGIAARHRVVTFDNRGVGGSGGTTPSTIDEMAEDAVAFIRALGLPRVHLLGFSMGGFVAQTIAIRHAALVDRLILTGTGPAGRGADAALGRLVQTAVAKAAAAGKHPKHFLFFGQTPAGQSAADEFLARLGKRGGDRVPALTPQAMQAHLAAIDAWGRADSSGLAGLTHPTFIANGDTDVMVPTASSFALHEAIADSRLSIFPDAGHGGIFQHHELFVRQALSFLDEPAASGAPPR